MAIHTQESLSGFIASEPLLTETAKGDARFFARIGKEHFRREEDGSFTQTETTYHHLVMFGRSAEHAHANFAQGDNFVAEGYTRPGRLRAQRPGDRGRRVHRQEDRPRRRANPLRGGPHPAQLGRTRRSRLRAAPANERCGPGRAGQHVSSGARP